MGNHFGMVKSASAIARQARIEKCARVMAAELAEKDKPMVHPEDAFEHNRAQCQRNIFKADETKLEAARNRRIAMRESSLGASLKGYL